MYLSTWILVIEIIISVNLTSIPNLFGIWIALISVKLSHILIETAFYLLLVNLFLYFFVVNNYVLLVVTAVTVSLMLPHLGGECYFQLLKDLILQKYFEFRVCLLERKCLFWDSAELYLWPLLFLFQCCWLWFILC